MPSLCNISPIIQGQYFDCTQFLFYEISPNSILCCNSIPRRIVLYQLQIVLNKDDFVFPVHEHGMFVTAVLL